MVKWLNRLIVANVVFATAATHFMEIGVDKELTALTPLDTAVIAWFVLSILLTFYLWIYLFVHWSRQRFDSEGFKWIWLIVLLVGGLMKFYGPLLYYLLVAEFKFSVAKPNKA